MSLSQTFKHYLYLNSSLDMISLSSTTTALKEWIKCNDCNEIPKVVNDRFHKH